MTFLAGLGGSGAAASVHAGVKVSLAELEQGGRDSLCCCQALQLGKEALDHLARQLAVLAYVLGRKRTTQLLLCVPEPSSQDVLKG